MTDQTLGDGQFSELLMTMDMVDSIRHRAGELEHHASEEERRNAYRDKLRELYRAQGVEVSDEVLEDAVQAQMDQRFSYTAPHGFAAGVARAWVRRWAVAKRGAAGAVLAAGVGGGYYGFVVAPEQARIGNEIAEINAWLSETPVAVAALQQRLSATGSTVDTFTTPAYADLVDDAVDAQIVGAEADLREARVLVGDLPSVDVPPLTRDTYPTRVAEYRRLRTEVDGLVTEANGELDAASGAVTSSRTLIDIERDADAAIARVQTADVPSDSQRQLRVQVRDLESALIAGDAQESRSLLAALSGSLAGLAELGSLQDTLARLLSEARDQSRSDDATATMEAMAADIRSNLAALNIDAAKEGIARFRRDIDILRSEYTLRIVSRPGVDSGVVRRARGGSASLHYLVVEAVSAGGGVVALPIRSEETGTVHSVERFGVRVPESVFERIREDKRDNGIIEDDVMGRKRAGYLAPEYRMQTAGGYITAW